MLEHPGPWPNLCWRSDVISVPDTKRCSSCRENLPLSEFHRKRSAIDGLQQYCRKCSRIAFLKWSSEGLTRRNKPAKVDKGPIEYTCKQCGAACSWERATGRPSNYCSANCKRIWNRASQRVRYKPAVKIPAEPKASLVCGYCGAQFKWRKVNGETAYCSTGCSNRAKSVNRKKYRICLWCDQPYWREWYAHGQRTCGRSCGMAMRLFENGLNVSPLAQCRCVVCDVQFVARNEKTVCSAECHKRERRSKWQAHYQRTQKRPDRQFICQTCEKTVTATGSGSARGKYCSKDCYRRSEAYKAQRIRSKVAYRTRRDGRPVNTDITVKGIIDRYGSACVVCGEKVGGNRLPVLHPMALTIDHVIPIARGGTHTWENVRLAHRICNSRKRDLPLKDVCAGTAA